MLIGIDASRANEQAKTGTEWYSYHLIQELKKIDTENQYILYSKQALMDGLELLPPLWRKKVLGWPPQKLWTQFRLSWEMFLHPPDLLFVPAHIIPPIHPRKTVTTCHDVGFERFPELYSQKELRYHRWSMRRAVKVATRIITVSEFTKREMVEVYNISPEKVDVIYNSYDDKIYRVIDDQGAIDNCRRRYSLDKPYFLYVGRLEHKKNSPFLVSAFMQFVQKYPDYQLVLAGLPGFGYEEVERELRQLDPEGRSIKQLGYVPEADLPYLHNGAFGFVFPSLYEGFGIPVLQAMACGLPVICSRIASLPEIGLHSALYFDPKKSDEFVSSLEQFVSSTALRADLRQKGLQRVKNFSWQKCAEQTLKLLRRVHRGVQQKNIA